MYSFQPLPDYSDSHVGFYVMSVFCTLAIAIVLSFWKEDEIDTTSMLGWAVVLCGLLFMCYKDSYTARHPLNEPHVGTFVGYQPEGYRERSGKSTADHHYIYVIYRVDGLDVLFQGDTGMAYPKRATIYKN